jgi:hypothetical protein
VQTYLRNYIKTEHLLSPTSGQSLEEGLIFGKFAFPKNFRQARKCPDYDIEWLPAMKQQFDSLERVWTIVPIIKPIMKVQGTPRQVYDEKMNPNTGKILRPSSLGSLRQL